MTDRLADVDARIDTVRQLDTVITAMRGMAAARAREARERLAGIRACAAMVGDAIGTALRLAEETERRAAQDDGRARTAGGATRARHLTHLVLTLTSEQGFAGVFNERIVDRALTLLSHGPSQCALIGDRGAIAAAERGIVPVWSAPMASHAGEVIALAGRIAEMLYERLDAGEVTRVSIVHAQPAASASVDVVERALLPFDFTCFAPAGGPVLPLVTLAPQRLLARLAQEYVHAQLCEALMLSFAAENEARMRAMIAARAHVRDKLGELIAAFHRLRQGEITSEIIELSAGGAGRAT